MVTALEHIVPQHLTSFVLTGKNKEIGEYICILCAQLRIGLSNKPLYLTFVMLVLTSLGLFLFFFIFRGWGTILIAQTLVPKSQKQTDVLFM